MSLLLMLISALFSIADICLPPDNVQINNYLQANWIEYDFGNVRAGSIVECDLVLKNTSTHPLKIQALIPGCIKYRNKKIRPHQTLKVHIQYDTRNKPLGYMENSIILCVDELTNPMNFALKIELI